MEMSWTGSVLGRGCHGLYCVKYVGSIRMRVGWLAPSIVLRHKIHANPKHRVGKHGVGFFILNIGPFSGVCIL